jgi:hypothetical protein
MDIPGVGPSISMGLQNIGIKTVDDLIGKNPEQLYGQSNAYAGCKQDRCLLYVYRCAVYYANTDEKELNKKKFKQKFGTVP